MKELEFYRAFYQDLISDSKANLNHSSLKTRRALSTVSSPPNGTPDAVRTLDNLGCAFSKFKASCHPDDLKVLVSSFETAYPQLRSAFQNQTHASCSQPIFDASLEAFCDVKRSEILARLETALEARPVGQQVFVGEADAVDV